MGRKRKINIQLSPKEAALVHYEMEFGRNETIKSQARILYYANQGADTITELCDKTGNCFRMVDRMLKLYGTMGTEAIYQCRRGKRINHLEQIGDELEQSLRFGSGLKQRIFVQKVKKHTGKIKPECTVVFSEQYSSATFRYGEKRLNYATFLRRCAFDLRLSMWILLVQKEKVCAFGIWTETSESSRIFERYNL